MVWYKAQHASAVLGGFGLGMLLEHFEQLEHARERAPGVSAVGAYPSFEPSVRSPVELEKKTDGLPRRW